MNTIKVIISGGGTGGHIFPAIAVANSLRKMRPEIEILFVGAEGKMEMEKVPAAGYKIVGLPVRGFQRKITWSNVTFFFRLLNSLQKAKQIIKEFEPDVVAGFGGFASGPILRVATKRGIPTLIQEQNSYAGVTNKILGQRVDKICVAYQDMEKYFPAEKILITGNPVRQDILNMTQKTKEDSFLYFQLKGNRKTILSLGGSLGALTINESIYNHLETLVKNNIQLVWQTGKMFYPIALEKVRQLNYDGIKVFDFISRMDYAYAIADVVISRAGAITISELGLTAKPAILVPSPNVAEDHQTKNAMTLVKNDAAMMIQDSEARQKLVEEAVKLLNDEFRLNVYRNNIARMAIKNSDEIIAREIIKLSKK
ncbi:MAG: undecaprenyldiphospho-muramoylpentapeptide beta-N-acetylglucosaminyltransferase [Bacteroidales bacterium]|nr:undecaprenyldiphospho-muramoylpentapeptide beta-N-acetylglucosaminyltransferase [Bacteroidales bacterium]